MTEVPEHLLKRAEDAKAKAGAKKAAPEDASGDAEAGGEAPADSGEAADPRIPAHQNR